MSIFDHADLLEWFRYIQIRLGSTLFGVAPRKYAHKLTVEGAAETKKGPSPDAVTALSTLVPSAGITRIRSSGRVIDTPLSPFTPELPHISCSLRLFLSYLQGGIPHPSKGGEIKGHSSPHPGEHSD